MLADTDIAARIIWLRNAANCDPRMEAATRWTLRVSACAFRQTLNFLKSLIPKDGATDVFPQSVSLYAAAFCPKAANTNCPRRLSAQRKSAQRAAGSSVVPVSWRPCLNPLRQRERDERAARRPGAGSSVAAERRDHDELLSIDLVRDRSCVAGVHHHRLP
jgi:hypothetical protein